MTTPQTPQSKNKFADLENAREETQKQTMAAIIKANHCPFCSENLDQYHREPNLKESTHWLLTKNQWPYQNTKVHLLFIAKQHATRLAELPAAAGAELIELAQWAEREFNMPGGALAMRFGDTDYSAGTIAHLHVQMLVPDISAPNYKDNPVKLKIGKTG